jgi:hypothetical protein
MWMIATTITLFITNVRVMADEYSGTILQRQSQAAHCHTTVTSHRTRRILHKNLIFRHFTYTAPAFMATVLPLLMELTEHRTKCTVQQHFTLLTDSVQ